jgi:hypothetical protein
MLAWSSGKSVPSPATIRRIVACVTAVTWTGAGALASSAAGLVQPAENRNATASTPEIGFRMI